MCCKSLIGLEIHRRDLGAQFFESGALDLADAALGEVEHLGDFALGDLLVEVEVEDDLLALGEGLEELGEDLALLDLDERLEGGGGVGLSRLGGGRRPLRRRLRG